MGRELGQGEVPAVLLRQRVGDPPHLVQGRVDGLVLDPLGRVVQTQPKGLGEYVHHPHQLLLEGDEVGEVRRGQRAQAGAVPAQEVGDLAVDRREVDVAPGAAGADALGRGLPPQDGGHGGVEVPEVADRGRSRSAHHLVELRAGGLPGRGQEVLGLRTDRLLERGRPLQRGPDRVLGIAAGQVAVEGRLGPGGDLMTALRHGSQLPRTGAGRCEGTGRRARAPGHPYRVARQTQRPDVGAQCRRGGLERRGDHHRVRGRPEMEDVLRRVDVLGDRHRHGGVAEQDQAGGLETHGDQGVALGGEGTHRNLGWRPEGAGRDVQRDRYALVGHRRHHPTLRPYRDGHGTGGRRGSGGIVVARPHRRRRVAAAPGQGKKCQESESRASPSRRRSTKHGGCLACHESRCLPSIARSRSPGKRNAARRLPPGTP